MTETPRYTAEQVRDEADHVFASDFREGKPSHPRYVRVLAMLDAFAQRLEQEEQLEPSYAFNQFSQAIGREVEQYLLADQIAKAREEGRREVYAQIASADACWVEKAYYESCQWCGIGRYSGDNHKPTCLWLRAQEATK